MTLCTAGLFAVSSPEQVLMIRVAPGGEMLGGACVCRWPSIWGMLSEPISEVLP